MAVLMLDDVRRGNYREKDQDRGFSDLLKTLGDVRYDYVTRLYDRSLVPVSSNLFPADGITHYFKNYIEYLTLCWGEHHGVVIEPNHIWYTLLCELASLVKGDPEPYRHLFTEQADKQTVIVVGGDIELPLGQLIEALRTVVPTDMDAFFPEFSTNTPRSRAASYAAFADMASPYYNYEMLACGFPAIDVRGEADDWRLMADRWQGLTELFGAHPQWFARVQQILADCVANRDNPGWWRGIYRNERCGSGSEVVVSGWFADLFREQPDLAKPENFPPGVSSVPYVVHGLGVDDYRFVMKQGLFAGRQEGTFLSPVFGRCVFNALDARQAFTPEERQDDPRVYPAKALYRLEPDNLTPTKLK